jgi:hypothetical protein
VESFEPAERQHLLHFWASYTRLPHTNFQGLHFKVRGLTLQVVQVDRVQLTLKLKAPL